MTSADLKMKRLAERVRLERERAVGSESELTTYMNEYLHNYGSAVILAHSLGITPQYLSDIVRGRRRVSDSVVQKLTQLREN